MRVFLDASVILAACGRNTGASRRIFDIHKHEGWALLASGYVMGEVRANIGALGAQAVTDWRRLESDLLFGARPICGGLAGRLRACQGQTGSFHGAGVCRCAPDPGQAGFWPFDGGGFLRIGNHETGGFFEEEPAQVIF